MCVCLERKNRLRAALMGTAGSREGRSECRQGKRARWQLYAPLFIMRVYIRFCTVLSVGLKYPELKLKNDPFPIDGFY